MRIRLIAIGKPTNEYRAVINEYEKRLPKYCTFEVLELKAEKDLLNKFRGLTIILESKGKTLTSEALAEFLKENKEITFVIGGDKGLSDMIKKKAQMLLSLSNMTLPHQLARLVITEQIYRAMTIIKGEKYHK